MAIIPRQYDFRRGGWNIIR